MFWETSMNIKKTCNRVSYKPLIISGVRIYRIAFVSFRSHHNSVPRKVPFLTLFKMENIMVRGEPFVSSLNPATNTGLKKRLEHKFQPVLVAGSGFEPETFGL